MDRTKEQLRVIGQEMFKDKEPHKLVTFLNRTLKDRGLIFGLTYDKQTDAYKVAIYDTNLPPIRNEEHDKM